MELIVQKIVECVLRAHDLFYPVRKLLVACSGGTDSLALLDAGRRSTRLNSGDNAESRMPSSA